jgi:branched-chain amino acid transport system ATP-binding protein
MLELDAVHAGYGASQVLQGISLTVARGGVTALLGANGAGKTTTLRAISGMIAWTGSIKMLGLTLSGLRPDEIARRGLAHVPQGRGTLTGLTVEENLLVGALHARSSKTAASDLAFCYTLFPRLNERRRAASGSLSGGEQQMLAIGRALMGRPKLMVLDEPSLGLAPRITREVFAILRALRDQRDLSILIVEQNAALALELADQAVVLQSGQVRVAGPAAQLSQMNEIRAAYLGR